MKIKIETDPFDCGKMYHKSEIEINPGLTVLVGCNGSGKTTFLQIISDNLRYNDNIIYIDFDNLHNGARSMISELVAFGGNIDIVADLMNSSEGEAISKTITHHFAKLGKLVDKHKEDKIESVVFTMDASDSGLSIDNIIDLKDGVKVISKRLKEEYGYESYFIIAANSYEMANNERCIDIPNCEYISFANYDEYRSFVLKSKKAKISRDKRWNKTIERRLKKEKEEKEKQKIKEQEILNKSSMHRLPVSREVL